jgi:hypothetical protein
VDYLTLLNQNDYQNQNHFHWLIYKNLTENFCKLANGNGFDFDNHSDLAKLNNPQRN